MSEQAVPPPTKAKRPTTEYPDILTLATVELDRQRSDRKRDFYLAQSDRTASRRYTVTRNKDFDTWQCDCRATVPCKHITRCKVLAAALWWERQLVGASVAELRALAVSKAQQVRTDCDALDAAAALLTIESLLLAADEPVAA
jgi:hypothetical protein